MKFWRVKEPDYESDYKSSYINGDLEHPFGMPGVECDVCGSTWGGGRILPHECPPALRNHKNIKERWPISLKEHKLLQQEVIKQFRELGVKISELRPGDDFQPCYLEVPSIPRADFLWASIGSLVVSERIKNVFLQYCPSDVAICNVILRKIGKRNAKLPPIMPSTGEPEDIINEVPLLKSVLGVGPYFEICILNSSAVSQASKICSGCKREDIDELIRRFIINDQVWKGNQIFFLATTLWVIVTNDLKAKIEEFKPTNVVFEEMLIS